MEEDATLEPEVTTGHAEHSDESEPDAADDLSDMPKWLSDAWQVHQAHKLEAAEAGPAVAKEHKSESSAPSDDAWRLMEEAAELRRALRDRDAMVEELRTQLNPPEPGGKENRSREEENRSSGDLAAASHKLVARRSGAAELAAEAEASHEQAANELWGTPRASSLEGGGRQGDRLQAPQSLALSLEEEIEAHQVRGKLEGCRLELQAEARKHCRPWETLGRACLPRRQRPTCSPRGSAPCACLAAVRTLASPPRVRYGYGKGTVRVRYGYGKGTAPRGGPPCAVALGHAGAVGRSAS